MTRPTSRMRATAIIESCESRRLMTYTQIVSAPGVTPIADNGTTFSYIEVPYSNSGTFSFADLDVILNIKHARDSDLDVYLVNPYGLKVKLFDDVGGDGDNFTATVLDDEAPSSITAAAAPFTGRFKPEEALSKFDNQPAGGLWRLDLVDDTAGTAGTLVNWQLSFGPGIVFKNTEKTDIPDPFTNPFTGNQQPGTIDSEIYPYISGLNVTDINVGVDITHPEIYGLDGTIEAFAGTSDSQGGPAVLFYGGLVSRTGANLSGTIFDDSAATWYRDGSAPLKGTYRPENTLRNVGHFSDQRTYAYQLTLTDDQVGNTGTLNSWFVEMRGLEMPAITSTGISVTDNSGSTTDKTVDFGSAPTTGNPFTTTRKFFVKNTTSGDQMFFVRQPGPKDQFSVTANGEAINSDFYQTEGGEMLHAGQSATIEVTFLPTFAGELSSPLEVNLGSATTYVLAKGTAVTSPLQVLDNDGKPFVLDSQLRHDLGAVAFGATFTYDILVKNTGTANVPLSTITFNRTRELGFESNPLAWDFNSGVINPPADGQLKPGQTVVKRLTFITDDYAADHGNSGQAAGGGNRVVSKVPFISDTVVPMRVADTDAAPRDMKASFANTTVNTATPRNLRFTLTNTQPDAYAISGLTRAGTNAGDFTPVVRDASGKIVTATSFSIPAGKAYTIDVAFKPTAAGARAAALQFRCGGSSGALMKLQLLGTGIAGALPPPAPSSVVPKIVSSTRVDLTWKDNSTSETGFVVQRALNSTFTSGKVDLNGGKAVAANATAYSDTSAAANTTYYYRVCAVSTAGVSYSAGVSAKTPARGTSTVRTRAAGGSSFKTAGGTTFNSTTGFTGGTTSAATFAVANTTDDLLYSNYRAGASFQFSQAVASGAYLLKLYFAEPDAASVVGKRKFNVIAEDKTIASSYDVYKAAGNVTRKAVVFSQNVIVADGRLSLGFTGVAGSAILSAVELVPA